MGVEAGAAAPYIAAGLGGLLSSFGNRGSQGNVKGFGETARGRELGLTPEDTLAKALGNIENLGAIYQERAAQPVSLPGAVVQPPPSYFGGGMPMPVGLTGIDPGLLRPSLLGSPGTRFAEPELEKGPGQVGWQPKDVYGPAERGAPGQGMAPSQPREWLFPGGTRRMQPHQFGMTPEDAGPDYFGGGYRGAEQSPPNIPALGGGYEGLADALKMLGVETDPGGRLVMGRNDPFFSGANVENWAGGPRARYAPDIPTNPDNPPSPTETTPDSRSPDDGGEGGPEAGGGPSIITAPNVPGRWEDNQTGFMGNQSVLPPGVARPTPRKRAANSSNLSFDIKTGGWV